MESIQNRALAKLLLHEFRTLRTELKDEARDRDEKIDRIAETVTGLRVDMAALKVKTGIMGALAGAVSGGGLAKIWHLLGK